MYEHPNGHGHIRDHPTWNMRRAGVPPIQARVRRLNLRPVAGAEVRM